MVLYLNLRSEILKMHSLCRRLQMELVFQTTHLAVARPTLKMGVEREGYSPRVWGCLEGPCQKLVIAFAVSFSYTEVMHTGIILIENESLHSRDK